MSFIYTVVVASRKLKEWVVFDSSEKVVSIKIIYKRSMDEATCLKIEIN